MGQKKLKLMAWWNSSWILCSQNLFKQTSIYCKEQKMYFKN